MTELFRAGDRNLITDVPGILVGNAHNEKLKSGVSVLFGTNPLLASCHVMGGAPGTRETDLLQPDKLVQMVDAVVLSGGSAFGLDSASGVSEKLQKKGRGFPTSKLSVPIVPAAILYDLNNGGNKSWRENPYKFLGKKAFDNISSTFKLGSFGAGTGATTMNLKGGLGSASLVLENGNTVGALVAVSSAGSVVIGNSKHFWAAPYEMDDEFGNLGPPKNFDKTFSGFPKQKPFRGQSTTLGIVATDAHLTKSQAKQIAVSAHDGFARAIYPSHTPFDGDIIFCVSTQKNQLNDTAFDIMKLGHAAAQCVARSIARAIFNAKSETTDTLPTWSDLNYNDITR